MAPISIKRSPSLANLDEPDRKKMKRSTVRHHKLAWDSQRQQRQDEVWQDEASLQSMLARSVALALEAVGFEAAEPGALSALCSDAEECTTRDCVKSPQTEITNALQIWPIF